MKKAIFFYFLLALSLILNFNKAPLFGQLTYDSRIGNKKILTPAPELTPRINGPKVYGVRPGMKFVYRIPCQGERPISFKVKDLPKGLKVDKNTGIIQGTVPKKPGAYNMVFTAENIHGEVSREFTIHIGDKIALTPPTGWNSWGGHMLFVSDSLMRYVADVFVEEGFADVGYQYIGIDDCWMRINTDKYESQSESRRKNHAGFNYNETVIGGERDKDGDISTIDAFPNMKEMTDYIHNYGLKAGIYSTPGSYTCQDFAGSKGHQEKDAKQYAEWGFDLLKFDLCSGKHELDSIRELNPDFTQAEYWTPMVKYTEAQDRDILFNLCQYGKEEPWKWAPEIGVETWRTGGDLNHHVDHYLEQAVRLATELRNYSKPGQWNDPDFMYIHKVRDYRAKGEPSSEIDLNTNQRYQYVTLWSVIAAPFFFSCDMYEIDSFTISLLTNAEILNINQDELGHVAEVVRNKDNELIMVKNMADNSKVVAILNSNSKEETEITVNLKDLGLTTGQQVFDVWRQKEIGIIDNAITVRLSPDGVSLLKLKNH